VFTHFVKLRHLVNHFFFPDVKGDLGVRSKEEKGKRLRNCKLGSMRGVVETTDIRWNCNFLGF